MQNHQMLVLAAFILLILAAIFEIFVPEPVPPRPRFAHALAWVGLALYVLAGLI